jgi:hypothetical protein
VKERDLSAVVLIASNKGEEIVLQGKVDLLFPEEIC